MINIPWLFILHQRINNDIYIYIHITSYGHKRETEEVAKAWREQNGNSLTSQVDGLDNNQIRNIDVIIFRRNKLSGMK